MSSSTTAELLLPVSDLSASQQFYEALGWIVFSVFPADSPRAVTLVGHGLRLRLEVSGGAPALRLCGVAATLASTAPEGTRLLVAPLAGAPPSLPPPPAPRASAEVCRTAAGAKPGRAGLLYRDLLPSRFGGRFIISSISVPEGGPVADYVHWHAVRLQLILVRRGWVRVAYEGCAAPFTMRAGDAVLQPPGIRHRVLAASAGLEVIELASPAEHETLADSAAVFPGSDGGGGGGGDVDGGGDDGAAGGSHVAAGVAPGAAGQRFVRHVARGAPWTAWRRGGSFEARDLGIAEATGGLAGVRAVRATAAGAATPCWAHGGELCWLFVDVGTLVLECAGETIALAAGDAALVPSGAPHALRDASSNLLLIEVTLPGNLEALAP